MGRAANLSALGLYDWDNNLFDLMVIPSALNKEVLVNNLLAETAELEILYPNPVVLKNLIGVWSRKQLDVWNRLYETTQYEYNPIENYNRYETGSTGGSGSSTETGTHGGTDTRTISRQEGGSETDASTTSVTDGGADTTAGTDKKGHWIAGFDAPSPTPTNDGLVKQTRDEETYSNTTTYGKTEQGTRNDTTTFGKTEAISDALSHGETLSKQTVTTNEGEHTLHAHGNIGVTTTQKLIREQRSIDLFNLYDIIIEDFKMRFCIMVY